MLACKMDLPGGFCHYGMRSPDGFEMCGKFVYREIGAAERLVFVSFSDKEGNPPRQFASPTWPLEVLNAMTLSQHEGRATVTLRGGPINATEEDRKTFEAGFESMQKGFCGNPGSTAAFTSGSIPKCKKTSGGVSIRALAIRLTDGGK